MADEGEVSLSEYLKRQRRRRDKQQLSCNPCRERKVRCDRYQPCERCQRRNAIADCIYAPLIPSPAPPRPIQQVHVVYRGHSLESEASLARAYPASIARASPQRTATWDKLTEGSIGRIDVAQNETNYVGGEHWAVIADKLAADQVPQNIPTSSSYPPRLRTSLPDLLSGSHTALTISELLASVPNKTQVDRLVSKSFSSLNGIGFLLHAPTFQSEYERFWSDPKVVSANWISILFSLMSIGTECSEHNTGLQSHPPDTISFFRQKSAESLIIGDYTRPTVYTVEALMLYFYSELLQSDSTNFGLSLILTTTIRTAMRVGYHRDPSHYSSISVFAGEMRRRVWTLLIQLDVLFSLDMGLPRLIDRLSSDTQEPRNLYDEDLHGAMDVLPPSRPEPSSPCTSYVLARVQLTSVLAMIQEDLMATKPLSYSRVIELDELLNARYQAIPANMKHHNSRFVTESPMNIIRRLTLDLLFQKARCVLHRRFMKHTHLLSWRACLEAALKIVQHQSFIYQESLPGGLLWGHKGKLTCMARFDFLLAVMIICLGAKWHRGSANTNTNTTRWPAEPDESDTLSLEHLYRALEESYLVWKAWSSEVKEIGKAVDIVKFVLDKVKRDRPPPTTTSIDHSEDRVSDPRGPESGLSGLASSDSDTLSVHHHPPIPRQSFPQSQAAGLEQAPHVAVNCESAAPSNDLPGAMNDALPPHVSSDMREEFLSSLSMLDDMNDSGAEIDWSLWDRHLQQSDFHSFEPNGRHAWL